MSRFDRFLQHVFNYGLAILIFLAPVSLLIMSVFTTSKD